MSEFVGQGQSELYWQKAVNAGVEHVIKGYGVVGEQRIIGRVFEYLGYAMMTELYPSPDYLVTKPPETSNLKMLLTKEERERWQPRFPDGIVLLHEGETVYRMIGLVEYKMINEIQLEDIGDQLEGFVGLLSLMHSENGVRGRNILKKFLQRSVNQLGGLDEAKIMYVVPSERSSADLFAEYSYIPNLQELKLPMSTYDIKKRMSKVRKKRK